MAWEKLCDVKEAGGLGVKNLQQFNIAMLAKQGWRLLNDSNPLVTSIIKAKYFPKTDFLNAKLGDNPSYMWRSIFAAQEVIKQGCRRSIGTGRDTFVWKVPWLPCTENGYLTTSMHQELESLKVCGLMEVHQRKWDNEILNDLFNSRDVQLIKNIPLVSMDKNDSWLWLFDANGEFTVKSCYRQLVGESNMSNAGFWKKLWSLELPGKVRFFLWRTCRSCLPTGKALVNKRVNIDGKCPWCRMEEEDEKHVLFECQFAKEVWTSTSMVQWVQISPGETISEVFRRLFSSGTRAQCALLALICWSLWNRRNKWLWNRVSVSIFGTTSSAMNLLTDWKTAQVDHVKHASASNINVRRWQAPQQNWVKINMDAAIFADIRTIGIGGIIRDANGKFLKAICKKVEGSWSPREAEALSLKEILSWTKQYGFTRCVFETDSKLLADACNGGSGRSYFHDIVRECVDLIKHFENVLVRFTHRSANEVAHTLARVSRSMSDLQEWDGVAPSFLSDVLTYDLI